MTLFKRDIDGSITGKKGKMLEGQWTTPELAYLADKEWEFTEKVDGTNIRIGYKWNRLNYYPNPEFAGRTDNAVIPMPLMEYLSKTFNKDLFEDNDLKEIILFGEGYGPKIQGGGKYRDDHSFVLFDVKIGDFWLDRANVDDIASKLGIDSVPVVGRGTLWDGIDMVSKHYENYVELPPLISSWGNFEAEGIVARPAVPLFNRKGERIICKIKAVDFK